MTICCKIIRLFNTSISLQDTRHSTLIPVIWIFFKRFWRVSVCFFRPHSALSIPRSQWTSWSREVGWGSSPVGQDVWLCNGTKKWLFMTIINDYYLFIIDNSACWNACLLNLSERSWKTRNKVYSSGLSLSGDDSQSPVGNRLSSTKNLPPTPFNFQWILAIVCPSSDPSDLPFTFNKGV